MTRLSWSRRKASGMMSPETHELRRSGTTYAIVQKINTDKWFSYGMGDFCNWNTSQTPATLEEAKADAMARVRAALKEEGD